MALFLARVTLVTHRYSPDYDPGERSEVLRIVVADSYGEAWDAVEKALTVNDPYGTSVRVEHVDLEQAIIAPGLESTVLKADVAS